MDGRKIWWRCVNWGKTMGMTWTEWSSQWWAWKEQWKEKWNGGKRVLCFMLHLTNRSIGGLQAHPLRACLFPGKDWKSEKTVFGILLCNLLDSVIRLRNLDSSLSKTPIAQCYTGSVMLPARELTSIYCFVHHQQPIGTSSSIFKQD